ncbi:CBS domain-containing protein [Qingshengfaniella alkalisoli]|uniref:CBS domain-containing protein n=1 Tax=Qingshengfaniella alkalisoli TaxID=2599296 RepID=A0A5B8IZN2_9RHOB|nr:CBS domain-containing protein [Qingshengfaniella alkalisoli]QDY71134.1 CBS domain-containing protein [Qingshengfaniella alkalisoli]
MVTYRPHVRKDDMDTSGHSQTVATNLAVEMPKVQHVLSHKGAGVVTVRPQATLGTIVEVLRDHDIGAVVVTNANGAILGILSERDIVRKLADAPGRTLPHRVEEVMTTKVETCTVGETLISVLHRMTVGRFRHMPVVDDAGLVGIVSIGDVINYRLTQLEQEALQLKQLIVG